ncbi:C10 family peptidase [Bacteroides acidifaciens]|uniref:C10 family peptidase n=1 Tax=Bacteroides acidifaciens TaxID=85831 RepID=UPI00214A79AE|nr:C10 family peptidase [Bacteroides acidifaciens]MCR2007287.1 C10 family peptidase [Bacteroides acidifaciens]
MIKKLIFLLITVAFTLASCNQQELSNIGVDNELQKPIELTPEEYASIAYNGDNNLSEKEILSIVKSFTEQSSTRGAENFTFTIGEKIRLEFPKTRAGDNISTTYAYYVNINNAGEKGIALVSGDKRFPEVLTYTLKAPTGDHPQNEGVRIMNEISKQAMLDEIAYYEHLQDSLQEKTLTKIKQQYGRDNVEFAEIKDEIYIKNSDYDPTLTPNGTPVSNIGYFTKTTWDQAYPYNAYLDRTEYKDYANYYYNYHFPTGCVITAGAQILAYYHPTVVADGVNIDWNLLLESPYIFSDESTKVHQVASLMKYMGRETNTVYGESGGTVSVENLFLFFTRYGITMDGPINGMNVARIKASLDALRMVIATGKKASAETGHAWLLDGYQIRRKNTREILKTNYIYIHANMGWGGTSDGYYLVKDDQSLFFNTANGLYNTNMKIYCNVRSTR